MLNAWLIASMLLVSDKPAPAAPMSTQVMIVGVFHMANPGLDLLNPSVKDVLGERRQKEILEVVARLEKFQPTRIALEVAPESPKLKQRLQKYLAGNYTLTASEVDQLGLRLAKNLNHRTVPGIDFEEDLPMEKAFRYAQQNQQGALVQGIMADVETQIKPRLSAG